MPRISRRPSHEQTYPLIKFLKSYLEENKISLRTVATRIGITPSHLSRILSGKIAPDAGVCNQIADALNMPRVHIYALAGWLELQSLDEQVKLEQLRSWFDPGYFQEIIQIYQNIGDRVIREKFIQLLQKLKDEFQSADQKRSG